MLETSPESAENCVEGIQRLKKLRKLNLVANRSLGCMIFRTWQPRNMNRIFQAFILRWQHGGCCTVKTLLRWFQWFPFLLWHEVRILAWRTGQIEVSEGLDMQMWGTHGHTTIPDITGNGMIEMRPKRDAGGPSCGWQPLGVHTKQLEANLAGRTEICKRANKGSILHCILQVFSRLSSYVLSSTFMTCLQADCRSMETRWTGIESSNEGLSLFAVALSHRNYKKDDRKTSCEDLKTKNSWRLLGVHPSFCNSQTVALQSKSGAGKQSPLDPDDGFLMVSHSGTWYRMYRWGLNSTRPLPKTRFGMTAREPRWAKPFMLFTTVLGLLPCTLWRLESFWFSGMVRVAHSQNRCRVKRAAS